MRLRLLLLTFASAVMALPVKAQMDSWMLDQWLNQMNMEVYQYQQQLGRQLQGLIKDEIKRQQEQSTATCLMLPNGNDTFFGYITFLYLSKDRVKMTVVDASGDNTVLQASSCFSAANNMLTPSIFTPGSKLIISDKNTGKVYTVCSIPKKESPDYENYVRNGYIIAGRLGAGGGGYSTDMPSGDSYQRSGTSTSVCSMCGGKGWISGSHTPTYGSTSRYWCEECDMEVGPSHSHDRCPSCSGLGYTKKIK